MCSSDLMRRSIVAAVGLSGAAVLVALTVSVFMVSPAFATLSITRSCSATADPTTISYSVTWDATDTTPTKLGISESAGSSALNAKADVARRVTHSEKLARSVTWESSLPQAGTHSSVYFWLYTGRGYSKELITCT